MKGLIFFVMVAFCPLSVAAMDIARCDTRMQVTNVAEPWDKFTRTYANGDVRLVVIDTIEPAAGSVYLVVLSPPRDTLGRRQCRRISPVETLGFGGLNLDRVHSDYDPAVGLTVTMPAQTFDGFEFLDRQLSVVINQATGDITASLE
ncbi:hypothetical protein [Litoreibacter roseus]|uniref:Uncharacterized protein n=1 Tax=Litoreibacter roseus TaxID=2601869 RepID=A0A6N6JJ63_9RHOB|nr:hypothetical protein [Litoreibacter roseus]GFE66403.1 hypothetical protein KIN_34770 [Litoreibacter roseus]